MRAFAALLVLGLCAGCEESTRQTENHKRNLAFQAQFEREMREADPGSWAPARLLEALAVADHNLRAQAAAELARRKDPAASAALRRCLATEEHDIVAAECARALLAIGWPEDYTAVRTYVAANTAEVHSLLIGALGQVDVDWAAELLREIQAQTKDNARRAQAQRALEARRHRLGD